MSTLATALFNENCGIFDLFEHRKKVYRPEDLPDDTAAIIFWGGGDIHPKIYGQAATEMTYGVDTWRDTFELNLVAHALKKGLPMIGICRGTQLLCSIAGGTLFQHVNNHAVGRLHEIEDKDGRKLQVTSLHHQMLNLEGTEHELIAWASPKLSDIYVTDMGRVEGPEKETEVVWFPAIKSLCIQGHPEYLADEHEFVQYSMDLVRKYIK